MPKEEEPKRSGRIAILTPQDARVTASERGQESLSKAGKRTLKAIAKEIAESAGEPIQFAVDNEYQWSPGYRLDDRDIPIIKRELERAGWQVRQFEAKSSSPGIGEGSWWSVSLTPKEN